MNEAILNIGHIVANDMEAICQGRVPYAKPIFRTLQTE